MENIIDSELNNLVRIENNRIVVSSRDIAEHFEKEHKTVLRSIENLKAQNCALPNMFYYNHMRKTTDWHRTLLDGSRLKFNSRFRMIRKASIITKKGMMSWYEKGVGMYEEDYFFADLC